MKKTCPGCKDGWSPHLNSCAVLRGGLPEAKQRKPPKFAHRKGEEAGYYCPICASPLLYVSYKRWLAGGADAVECEKPDCLLTDGCSLILHHPDSMDREAGDSWSLTWLK